MALRANVLAKGFSGIRRETLVRNNFERYFAPNIAAEIAQQDASVPIGGDRRPMGRRTR